MTLQVIDLRDWFAGLAMQTLLKTESSYSYAKVAEICYLAADSMLAEKARMDETGVVLLDPKLIKYSDSQIRDCGSNDPSYLQLLNSIKMVGQFNPIVVEEFESCNYRLINGGRRLIAALELKLEFVKVKLFDVNSPKAGVITRDLLSQPRRK